MIGRPLLLTAVLLLPAADGPPNDQRIAARGAGQELTVERLESVLVDRYGLDEVGREVLKGMIDLAVVQHLAEERGVSVSEEEVRAAWNELDEEVRKSGETGGLAAQLRAQGIDPEAFRHDFRVAVLHEKLTRQALGLPADADVSGEKQRIWLEQEKTSLGGQEILSRPWEDGVVARCGPVRIHVDEFGAVLRGRLPADDVRQTAWHCLLLAAIRARLPDVSAEALDREVSAEIERRRQRNARENPGYALEQVLAARGRNLGLLREDPSVKIAALAHVWVDRTAGEEGLRRTYERERAHFEGLYGEAVRTHFLFLIAGRFQNELNPRTYEMAEAELQRMMQHVGNTDDFAALCEQFSEHPETRQKGGDLGFVTRETPRIPELLRRAIFEQIARQPELPPEGVAVGPVRLGNPSGCAMLWLSARRDSPPWEQMSEYVHEELRARFLDEVLREADVQVEVE